MGPLVPALADASPFIITSQRAYQYNEDVGNVGGGDNNDEYVDMNVDEDGVKIIDVKNEDVGDVKLNDDDGVPIKETNIDYDHVEDVDADINVDIFYP
ncbi:hypothetical protein Tco_0821230 [Tanacetum coccineum]|uniref:Uncharacterized protein n=1 Tax=Tanacetum coccineum TaxID=301880 RepID=A0ABQ5AFW4_9ASTR